MMKERELNKLLDKAIGTKGNLKVPSFWMRQIFKELIEWCNSLNNSLDYVTEEELNNRNYVTETELELKKCRIDWYIIVNPRKRYLTFKALENGTFSFTKKGIGDDIQYSKDDGATWISGKSVSVVTGDKVIWKSTIIPGNYGIGTFSSTAKFNVEGNIMSMIYGDDFIGQTDLTGKDRAFCNLFENCTNVVKAHNLILPATTLCEGCYQAMFYNCTSLTTAPELPATTLHEYCYYEMFRYCSSLNYIKMLATDISAENCLTLWVNNVSSTGTFVKAEGVEIPTGRHGIPEGWEVKNHITPTECTSLTITADNVVGNYTTTIIHYTAICNGVDYKGNTVTGIIKEGTTVSAEFPQNTSETETVERTITFELLGVTVSTTITQGAWINFEQQYLTFKAIKDSTFKLTQNSCEYSLDEGDTWISLSARTNTPIVSAGNKIMFKATNPTISSDYGIGTFSSTGKFNVEGNIMSMLYGDDFIGQNDLTGKNYAFYHLFENCTNVVEAHNLILPATTLSGYCYAWMFYNCTSLVNAPELPATTLANHCYFYMFHNCISLVTAPELSATTLHERCYQAMFLGCSSLNYIKMLATDISAESCLSFWVKDVAPTGTFVKAEGVEIPMAAEKNYYFGIPEGWEVVDYVES